MRGKDKMHIMPASKTCTLWLGAILSLCTPLVCHAEIILLTEESYLNFGIASRPPSGNVKIVVKNNGALGNGTNATMIDDTIVDRGRIRIARVDNTTNTISIDVQNVSVPSGYDWYDIKIRYRGTTYSTADGTLPATGLQRPARNNGTPINIFGKIRVYNNATPGQHQINYDVVVLEE